MNVFNVFDFRVSFSLIRENLGTLISVSNVVNLCNNVNISKFLYKRCEQ